ncbi:extensin-like [Lathyrus oleraceus]|uniref:extensin-like n=1 Tax=Pisum sativum TaxID=3888 RepID=UPI0021CFDC33|nr:extensin-like [Pisum sativum]
MKRMREPSEKSKKAKKAKLGETYGSRPLVPLADSPSQSLPPSRSVKLKPIASSLRQTTPVYTQSEIPPSTTKTSKPPSLKFNLATTILPARALASQQPQQPKPEPEVTSPPSEKQNPSPFEQPQTPPPEQPTPSPSEHQPSPSPAQTTPPPSDIPPLPTSEDIITPSNPIDTYPTPPSSPSFNPEPETAFPTLEEAITLFVESSVEKIKSLSINSGISDDPSTMRIH